MCIATTLCLAFVRVYKINKHTVHRTSERNSIEEMNWMPESENNYTSTSEVEMKTTPPAAATERTTKTYNEPSILFVVAL